MVYDNISNFLLSDRNLPHLRKCRRRGGVLDGAQPWLGVSTMGEKSIREIAATRRGANPRNAINRICFQELLQTYRSGQKMRGFYSKFAGLRPCS